MGGSPPQFNNFLKADGLKKRLMKSNSTFYRYPMVEAHFALHRSSVRVQTQT